MKTIAACALLACLSLQPGAARAEESLEDEEMWRTQESYLDRSVLSTEETCGVKIPYEWDKKSLLDPKAQEQMKANSASINGRASAVYDALQSICRDTKSGKERIGKKIKKLVVRWGGPGKLALTLQGGTLTFAMDYAAVNVSEYIDRALKKSL